MAEWSRTVNVAKGLAIILMVLGDASFLKYGVRFIYMFHMPLFFFLSGYCFKDSYLKDFKTYTVKRVKGAYLPFVLWSCIFLLLHNFFFNFHIYDLEYGGSIYSTHDYIIKMLKIVGAMQQTESLLGGYWFLHTYFISSFLMFFVVWICKNIQYRMIWGG